MSNREKYDFNFNFIVHLCFVPQQCNLSFAEFFLGESSFGLVLKPILVLRLGSNLAFGFWIGLACVPFIFESRFKNKSCLFV
jgi:hypothetical protein